MPDELLTLQEVADELKLHIETVRDYIRRKKIASIKISPREYRVRRSALEKFLQDREIKEE